MKINKHVLTLLFTLLLFSAFSQNTSFSKVISPYGNIHSASFSATSIIKQNNNYLLSLTGFDTANISTNVKSLYFAKVDSNGENFEIINKYNPLDTNYNDYFGNFIKTHNSGYCYLGDITWTYDTNWFPQSTHFIMLFDSSMNNTLIKHLPIDTIPEIIRNIKETHDHGFIIVGQRYANDYQDNVLIIKTDSLGNQLWKTNIATGDLSAGEQIEETSDKGFLIRGYRFSIAQHYAWPFILKIDSVGNFLWDHFFGSVGINGDASFAITYEGDYIVAYGYAVYTETNGQYFLARINVIKYTPDGTEIWNRMFDTIRLNNCVNKIQVLPNSDFIVMGSNGKMNDLDSYFHFETFCMKFNSNGDSIWRKAYFYSAQFVDENYLIDNILNTDGSITACGSVDGDTIVPYQKIWILKTDSNGYAPGCYPTGIEEIQYIKAEGIKIYPNPANTQFTIAFKDVMNSNAIVELYGSMGNLVLTDYMQKDTYIKNIDVSKLNSGLYFYNISINGAKVSSGKLTILNN